MRENVTEYEDEYKQGIFNYFGGFELFQFQKDFNLSATFSISHD